jgi:hypothetical protein
MSTIRISSIKEVGKVLWTKKEATNEKSGTLASFLLSVLLSFDYEPGMFLL